jgi:hypothetical protein
LALCCTTRCHDGAEPNTFRIRRDHDYQAKVLVAPNLDGRSSRRSVIELCFGGHRYRRGIAHNGRSDRSHWLHEYLRRIRLDGYYRRSHCSRRGHNHRRDHCEGPPLVSTVKLAGRRTGRSPNNRSRKIRPSTITSIPERCPRAMRFSHRTLLGIFFFPGCSSGLSNTERKRLHSIAHTCEPLGGHGAWWFWPRRRH